MGNIWSKSSSNLGISFKKDDLVPAEDLSSGEIQVNGTVRLYVVFVKSDGDTLDISAEAEKLQNALPANATFKVKRIDEAGHAAVIETDGRLVDKISAFENVENVILETPAELTGEENLVKKNEETSQPLEETAVSIVESDSDNAIDNASGFGNEIAVSETVTVQSLDSDSGVFETHMRSGVLIIGVALIVTIALIVLFTRRKK